jgi:hypothetical protein
VSIAANEEVSVDTRVVAAAHAAPYMFPRLSASVVATTQTAAKGVDVVALMTRLSDRIARLKPPVTVEGTATETSDQVAAA